MRSQSTLWLVLWLMVTLPLSGMAQPSSTGHDFDVDEQAPETTAVSEEERLAKAASHWSLLPQPQVLAGDVANSTGTIHLAAGSFDPLLGEGPEVPKGFDRQNDGLTTGLAIVQLHAPNGDVMEDLAKHHSLEVLDVLHDAAWLVRLPSPPALAIEGLQVSELVRWVGHQQPGWRLAPTLHETWGEVDALTVMV